MRIMVTAAALVVMVMRFTFVMGQTSDFQKKCEDAFIRHMNQTPASAQCSDQRSASKIEWGAVGGHIVADTGDDNGDVEPGDDTDDGGENGGGGRDSHGGDK